MSKTRMTKLTIHSLLAAAALTLTSSGTALAQDIVAGGIYYDIIADDQVAVVPAWDEEHGVNAYEGIIILPEQVHCDGVNYAVTVIGDRAFQQSAVTHVQVPNSVTTIGVAAFADAEQLTGVTLPLGLTTVSNFMFAGSAVVDVAVPEGVTTIGIGAFQGCPQLTTVFLPSTLRRVGAYAFNACYNLTDLYCAASMPPDVSARGVFEGLEHIDVLLPDATAARHYMANAVWDNDDTFTLWINRGITFVPHLDSEPFEHDWLSVELGRHMAYKVYGPDGYLVALTAAPRYYQHREGEPLEYLVVPTDLTYDDEEQQLAFTVLPAAIDETEADPVPTPLITGIDGTIDIGGDTHGLWTWVYDVYGNLWYESPSMNNWIGNLPGNRMYIVRVGNHVRKVFLNGY